jgi:hypothetical protein
MRVLASFIRQGKSLKNLLFQELFLSDVAIKSPKPEAKERKKGKFRLIKNAGKELKNERQQQRFGSDIFYQGFQLLIIFKI